MITGSFAIGEFVLPYRIPPTARDVLDWTVWISARDSDPRESAKRALQWAAQWTDYSPTGLDEVLAEHAPDNAFVSLVELCNDIAASAGLPESVLDEVGKLLDRKNEVPLTFRPDGLCGCPSCVSARHGVERENPTGAACLFDGIDPRAIVALRAVDVEDASQPYYVAQVKAAVASAESRRFQYERQEREERSRWEKAMADKGLMRRDH